MNDAMAIVMCQCIEHYFTDSASAAVSESLSEEAAILKAFLNFAYIFFGSTAVGAGVGAINALLEKFAPSVHSHPGMETGLFMLISYSSYLTAQVK